MWSTDQQHQYHLKIMAWEPLLQTDSLPSDLLQDCKGYAFSYSLFFLHHLNLPLYYTFPAPVYAVSNCPWSKFFSSCCFIFGVPFSAKLFTLAVQMHGPSLIRSWALSSYFYLSPASITPLKLTLSKSAPRSWLRNSKVICQSSSYKTFEQHWAPPTPFSLKHISLFASVNLDSWFSSYFTGCSFSASFSGSSFPNSLHMKNEARFGPCPFGCTLFKGCFSHSHGLKSEAYPGQGSGYPHPSYNQ